MHNSRQSAHFYVALGESMAPMVSMVATTFYEPNLGFADVCEPPGD
jgi:hypothetical protein